VVEVLELDNLSCPDHAFHSKLHNISDSVRTNMVDDSYFLAQPRVMFRVSNQSARSL
jgi:hypothetical protein